MKRTVPVVARGGARLRRSRALALYWAGETLVIENFATRKRARGHPVTLSVLSFFDDWTNPDAYLAVAPSRPARALLRQLVRLGFLVEEGRVPDAERAMEQWRDWNPSAGLFHAQCKGTAFEPWETSRAVRSKKVRHTPRPPATKAYRGRPIARLPKPVSGGEFASTLLRRRTWRQFGSSRIALREVSTLLGLAAGVQRWERASEGHDVALKTSPSGGAVHSIEVYVLARAIRGLGSGLYHYDASRHLLERLRGPAGRATIARYLPHQPWFEDAALLVFFSPVFERSLWRYAYPRAYRAIAAEAGHLCQTFLLAATWLGLAPFCTMAIDERAIERDLGLDGISESVFYVAGVGARPEGVDWAPNPPGEPGRPG